ncbi:MAG: SPOR domain-containing protein, partial [Pseudomonadota bacterium]
EPTSPQVLQDVSGAVPGVEDSTGALSDNGEESDSLPSSGENTVTSLQASVQTPQPSTIQQPSTQSLANTRVPQASDASADKRAPELDVASVGFDQGGNWRIQIAALRSEQAARGEWRRLANEFPNLMRPLQLSVESVDIAGQGTYYRVRGGYLASRQAATQVCDALKQNRVDCLVVRPGR